MAGGHILIESVPGLAKTTAAQTLATSVSGSFKRVQCTPDLMPSDLVGTQVFDFATQKFSTQIGPIHANFVLLDEINRSNAKTQSAMLEAMAEGATTIGGQCIALPKPFMVIATQNPIEEEGTFNLPEAQMDRFMMKAVMTYPTAQEEQRMLTMLTHRGSDTFDSRTLTGDVVSISDVEFLRAAARRVHVRRNHEIRGRYHCHIPRSRHQAGAGIVHTSASRSLATRVHRADSHRTGQRVDARPRLCDSGRRQSLHT